MRVRVCQLCPLLLSHFHYSVSVSSKFQHNDWPMANAKEKFAVPSWLELVVVSVQVSGLKWKKVLGKHFFTLGVWVRIRGWCDLGDISHKMEA